MIAARVALVLEDMDFRVEWLEKTLEGTGVSVIWCPTVREFREALALNPSPALIVLDHDLGQASIKSEDANGETGLDGAKAIPVGCTAPVIIWSLNTSAPERMAIELRSRGIVCRRAPFINENKFALMKTVLECIGGAR